MEWLLFTWRTILNEKRRLSKKCLDVFFRIARPETICSNRLHNKGKGINTIKMHILLDIINIMRHVQLNPSGGFGVMNRAKRRRQDHQTGHDQLADLGAKISPELLFIKDFFALHVRGSNDF